MSIIGQKLVSEYYKTITMISTRTGINDGSATLGPDTMIFSAEREKSSQFGTIFTGPAKSQIALIEVILRCNYLILPHTVKSLLVVALE